MRVGILGAGQLGRMLALAGYPLGLRFRFLDPADAPAAAELGELVAAGFDDYNALARFAAGLDVVTYEFENVPVPAARFLERTLPVHPSATALEIAQERWDEKRFFEGLRIPTAKARPVDTRAELYDAIAEIGLPAILKTRRLGYDGKGQTRIDRETDADAAWSELRGAACLLEELIGFHRELSMIGVRSTRGEIALYPLVENEHAGGVLRRTTAPAWDVSASLHEQAAHAIQASMRALDYVGVMAIEFFERDGELLVNEMAPRVHNSGHWTIEGAVTSQFENHLRAIAGLPLGSTDPVGHAVMLNLIGRMPAQADLLSIPGAHLHLYGKESRVGRKLGHVTLWGVDADRVATASASLQSKLD